MIALVDTCWVTSSRNIQESWRETEILSSYEEQLRKLGKLLKKYTLPKDSGSSSSREGAAEGGLWPERWGSVAESLHGSVGRDAEDTGGCCCVFETLWTSTSSRSIRMSELRAQLAPKRWKMSNWQKKKQTISHKPSSYSLTAPGKCSFSLQDS